MDHKKHRQGILAIIFACICWSTVGAFVKVLHLPAPTFIFYRSCIASLFLFCYTFFIQKQNPFPLPKKITPWLLTLAATGSIVCFIYANFLTTSANAIFLQFFSVPIIVLVSVFWFKEPFSTINKIALTLCCIGLSLFFAGGLSSDGFLGNLLGLAAGVWISINALVLNKGSVTNPLPFAAYGSVIASLLMIPTIPSFAITLTEGAALLFLGIFQIGLATVFYSKGAQQVTAQEIALYGLLEPLLNPVWTFVVVGEVPSIGAFAGAFLILVALLYKSRDSHPALQTATFD